MSGDNLKSWLGSLTTSQLTRSYSNLDPDLELTMQLGATSDHDYDRDKFRFWLGALEISDLDWDLWQSQTLTKSCDNLRPWLGAETISDPD